MRTFSSTLRCGKTAEIWKERTSPFRAISDARSLVMSRPLKWISPRVGVRKCVSRLKQVVLPAPFGPISAWMVPRRTVRSTFFTATKPRNSFVRPRVSRMASCVIGSWMLTGTACSLLCVDRSQRSAIASHGRDYADSLRGWQRIALLILIVPSRRSLAEKCIDAFVRVRIEQIAAHHGCGGRIGRDHVLLDLPVESSLAEADDPATAQHNSLRE